MVCTPSSSTNYSVQCLSKIWLNFAKFLILLENVLRKPSIVIKLTLMLSGFSWKVFKLAKMHFRKTLYTCTCWKNLLYFLRFSHFLQTRTNSPRKEGFHIQHSSSYPTEYQYLHLWEQANHLKAALQSTLYNIPLEIRRNDINLELSRQA